MRKNAILAAFAALYLMLGGHSSAAEVRSIDNLRWLVGGTWIADSSKLGHGSQRIETDYRWAPNNAYIVFKTTFVSDKGSLVNYAGNFFGAEPSGNLTMWYMDAQGKVTQGPITVNGTGWYTTFADGGATYRVEITRKTDDLYNWALSAQVGNTWRPVFALDYSRTR